MSERSVPKWVNSMMKFMLRSPFHRGISQSIMLITFTGRKTGKRYTTPIRYLQTHNKVIAFTQEKWWKNLETKTPIELRLRGDRVRGIPTPVMGSTSPIQTSLQDFLQHFPSDAKYYAVAVDEHGQPNPDDVLKAAQNTIMLEIQLQTP